MPPKDASAKSQMLSSIVARFERAWQAGRVPAIDQFLGDSSVDRRSLLVELVHTDLEYRLKAGEQVSVEDYLRQHPELEANGPELVALIEAEYSHRRLLGHTLQVEHYLNRFPRFRTYLSGRLRKIEDGTVPRRQKTSHSLGSQSAADATQPPSGKVADAAPVVPPAASSQRNIETVPPSVATPSPSPSAATPVQQDSQETVAPRVAAKPNPKQPAPRIVPGYEILGVLGKGGMGVVYKARHLKLNRIVALKMIKAGAHADGEDIARFRAEAEAVARLQHPNIVQIHEIGESGGQPYFAAGVLRPPAAWTANCRASSSRRRRPPSSWKRWPSPWTTPIASMSSIATSSRPMCCSMPTANRR